MKRGGASKSLRRCVRRRGSLPASTCAECTANRRVPCAWPKHRIPFVLPRRHSCCCQGCSTLNNEILRLPRHRRGLGAAPEPARAGAPTAMASPCREQPEGRALARPLAGELPSSRLPAGSRPRRRAGRVAAARRPVKAAASRWCCSAGNEHRLPGKPPGIHPPTRGRGRPGERSRAAPSSCSAPLCTPPAPNQARGAVKVQPFRQPWAGRMVGSAGFI